MQFQVRPPVSASFDTAIEAAEAIAKFAASEKIERAFEINPAFNVSRLLLGFQVKVKDLDGFTVGFLVN